MQQANKSEVITKTLYDKTINNLFEIITIAVDFLFCFFFAPYAQ
jgi:hypothetical protein